MANDAADAEVAPPEVDPDARRRWIRLTALGALVIGLFVAAKVSGLTAHLKTEEIRAWMASAGWWGPIGYLGAFSVGELVHVPGWVFVLAAVVSYGRVAGGALAFVGAILSLSVSFAIVRGVGGKPLGAIRWPFVRRMLAQLDAHPVRTIIILRTVLWLTPQLNYVLALSTVRWRHYLIGSILGLIAPMVALAFLLDRYAYLIYTITLSPVFLLALIVWMGTTISTAVGFGSTLTIVAVGSLVMPVQSVLFRIMPLTTALSFYIVLRNPRAVDLRTLLTRILPVTALGLPVGIYLADAAPQSTLERAFAASVFVLAAAELIAMARKDASRTRTLSLPASLLLLFLGGVAHGAFATGGPPVVYVCARTIPDKTVFRATLNALWIPLSGALLVTYVAKGHITMATLKDTAPLVPGLIVGIVVGELLHGRVPERVFRVVVFATLLVVAVLIGVRA